MVRGAGKKYSQDRYVVRRTADGEAVVLAVADGHGSAPHFRSDLGARWAVGVFAGLALGFAERAVSHRSSERRWGVLRAEAQTLPQQLVHQWREKALLHEANSPARGGPPLPSPRVRPATDAAGRPTEPPAGPLAQDLTPYGTTLVGAVVTDWLTVCWQLGDGDVVLVDAGGVPRAPLDVGEELGDETDSLCEAEAWRQTRTHWEPVTGEGGLPPAVLISTDGLAKSFTDRAGFLEFAGGVTQRAADQGVPAVQDQLADWLGRAGRFSGDDTTLVAAFAPGSLESTSEDTSHDTHEAYEAYDDGRGTAL
ncbi:protein phosphatase 2C domain-containing protein [Streptomyces sp. NPDC048172]|uniref:protein phosphatase 2C domain-containing protein n=1 Tax=Streptomyces sp. NPDC048172 TaxID=3365505 RepID=UPI0037195F52